MWGQQVNTISLTKHNWEGADVHVTPERLKSSECVFADFYLTSISIYSLCDLVERYHILFQFHLNFFCAEHKAPTSPDHLIELYWKSIRALLTHFFLVMMRY